MIGFTAQRLMALEVEGLTGAAPGERTPDGSTSATVTATGLGDARRHGGTAHPEAAQRQLLPGLPGAASPSREGADGGGAGGLRAWHLDPLGRRAGPGDGDDRHLQKSGLAALRGDRREGPSLPRPADRRRLALHLARRDLPEGTAERADCVGGGHCRRRGQYPTVAARCSA